MSSRVIGFLGVIVLAILHIGDAAAQPLMGYVAAKNANQNGSMFSGRASQSSAISKAETSASNTARRCSMANTIR